MSFQNCLLITVLLALVLVVPGCARAHRDTDGYALERSATVPAAFDATWQGVKDVLQENDFKIYTRDKRGRFVAYSEANRHWGMRMNRTRKEYTILLTKVSNEETKVSITTMHQVYGVTLLTYPGWHDRPTVDDAASEALLQSLQEKLG